MPKGVTQKIYNTIKTKWDSAFIDTLNGNIKFRQKDVDKSTVKEEVGFCDNTPIFEKVKNSLLINGWGAISHCVSFWMFFVSLFSFFCSPFLYFRDKHGIMRKHSFSRIRTFSSNVWRWIAVNPIRKKFGLLSPSIISTNPRLGYDNRRWFSFNTKFVENTHKGSKINAPLVDEFTHGGSAVDVHGGDGFASGAPLDRFNSVIDFLCYSLWHSKFNLIIKRANVQYNGNVNNLSIEEDESYITELGIVHNCLCILIQETSRARVTNVNRMKTLETHLEGVMDDTFKNNVGKTGEAFPRHPYFEVAKKDESLARRNFDLPIPDIRNLMIEDEQIPIRLSDYEL